MRRSDKLTECNRHHLALDGVDAHLLDLGSFIDRVADNKCVNKRSTIQQLAIEQIEHVLRMVFECRKCGQRQVIPDLD